MEGKLPKNNFSVVSLPFYQPLHRRLTQSVLVTVYNNNCTCISIKNYKNYRSDFIDSFFMFYLSFKVVLISLLCLNMFHDHLVWGFNFISVYFSQKYVLPTADVFYIWLEIPLMFVSVGSILWHSSTFTYVGERYWCTEGNVWTCADICAKNSKGTQLINKSLACVCLTRFVIMAPLTLSLFNVAQCYKHWISTWLNSSVVLLFFIRPAFSKKNVYLLDNLGSFFFLN